MKKVTLEVVDYLALMGLAYGSAVPDECRFAIPLSMHRHGLTPRLWGDAAEQVWDMYGKADRIRNLTESENAILSE